MIFFFKMSKYFFSEKKIKSNYFVQYSLQGGEEYIPHNANQTVHRTVLTVHRTVHTIHKTVHNGSSYPSFLPHPNSKHRCQMGSNT